MNIWKMLGLERKGAPDTSYLTQGVGPFQSLTEIPVGASLNDMILKGLKGEGWGYDPSFVDKTTSPVVAQREARWKERELPGLSSQMSSRGLGRSTIAGGEIARAQGAKERDINDIIGQAYLTNEQQKKLDEAQRAKEMESFRNAGLSFAGGEAGQSNIYADTTAKRREYQINKEAAFKQAERDNIKSAIDSALTTASTVLTKGGSVLGKGGTSGGSDSSLTSLLGGGSSSGRTASSILGSGYAVGNTNTGSSVGGESVNWTALMDAITRAENAKKANPFTK